YRPSARPAAAVPYRGTPAPDGAYAPEMMRDPGPRTISSVLAAAEAASPVDAVEAVTRELGLALGATKVSFLIADLSGRALVRVPRSTARLHTGGGARTT